MAKRILVKSPSGEIGDVDLSEYKDALQSGYEPLSPGEVKEQKLQEQYGEGAGNELRAALEGAARGLSIGTSDAILQAFGADQEGLRERKERNPISAGVGEVAGIAAPLAVSALAGPAGPGAVAASVAARTPVGLLARGTLAAGEAGAAAIQGTRVANILGRAAAPAIGSAIEGAAYGLGQSVSEEALGEPGLNAERLLQNVGLGGLFGGALGGVFGALAKATPESIIDDAVRAADGGASKSAQSLTDVAADAGLDKEGYIAGLSRKRAGAKATEEAAQELGLPVYEGMIGGHEVQKLDDLVMNSSSMPGVARKKLYDEAFDMAEHKVMDTLGQNSGQSMAQVGEALRDGIVTKFEAKIAPTKKLYEDLAESAKNISIPETSRLRIGKNIRNIIKEDEIFDSSARSFLETVAQRMEEVSTLDGIKSIQSGVNQAAKANPALWHAAGRIDDKLDSLRLRIISKTAAEMPKGEARTLTVNLLKEKKVADEAYKALRKEMDPFAQAMFGQKRINGPQHFLKLLDDANPEKFAQKLFTKQNARHLEFMAKNFPEETQLLARYQKDKILQVADGIKGDKARLNSIFKSVNKMEPEAKKFIFTPDELKTLKNAETYIDAFPPKYNGSGTAHATDALNFFSNPVSAANITVRDFAMLRAVRGLGPQAENQVKALSTMERMIQKTARGIETKSKAIVSGTKGIIRDVPAGALGVGLVPENKKRSEKDTIKLINDLSSNPEKLIEKLDEATADVAAFAPKISESMGFSASQAVQFLASKVPEKPNTGPLGPKVEPSGHEIAKFNRYASVVEDPLSVLDQVQSGTLTMESMEALNTVFPGLYSEMKMQLMEQIADVADEDGDASHIPYSTKLSLSMFLGDDLMTSLSQPMIQMNQMALMGSGGNDRKDDIGPKPTQKGLSEVAKSERLLTPMQKSSMRGMDV